MPLVLIRLIRGHMLSINFCTGNFVQFLLAGNIREHSGVNLKPKMVIWYHYNKLVMSCNRKKKFTRFSLKLNFCTCSES